MTERTGRSKVRARGSQRTFAAIAAVAAIGAGIGTGQFGASAQQGQAAAGIESRSRDEPGAAAREPLNSELIEARFGSYAIEVLSSDDVLRVSNLFSAHDDTPITRTLAVVRYPQSVDPVFAAEHALILAGGSIGATFVASGWRVLKAHRYFGQIESTAELGRLMADDRSPLAVHVYELDVAKDSRRVPYAMIAEVHHRDYLELPELVELYAPGYLAGGGDDVDAMLESVQTALADLPAP